MFIKTLLKSFNLENEVFKSSKPGRKGYALHKMGSLVYYSYGGGFTKASVIADLAKHHTYFKYVANGIGPDEDTINEFINKWGSFFEYLITYTVHFAKLVNFTEFEIIDIDGSPIESANNKFNVIHKEDAILLLDYYMGHIISKDDLTNLRLPAKKIMNREDMSNLKKIELLKNILDQFDKTGANTIPINDFESIHLVDKENNPDVGYNMQLAVDYMSKMIVAVLITQKATDHNQFP